MKKVSTSFIQADKEGRVTLIPETDDDLWQLYNIIRAGDIVGAQTHRKIKIDTGTREKTESVQLHLNLTVINVDYDVEGQSLRIKGKQQSNNQSKYIQANAYHTLEVELFRKITLSKEEWDRYDIRTLMGACKPELQAELAVLLIEEGLANMYLIGEHITTNKAKIQQNLPRKTGMGSLGFEKAYAKFQNAVLRAVMSHLDFNRIKCFVIAGPGFAKEQFVSYLISQAQSQHGAGVAKEGDLSSFKEVLSNQKRIIQTKASSAYRQSLKDVMESPVVMNQISDTKAIKEIQALQSFYDIMSKNSNRAIYGADDIFIANKQGAIETLLILDSQLRTADLSLRQKYIDMMDQVYKQGGKCYVFSSQHISSKQLEQLTGIAAITRFEVQELL